MGFRERKRADESHLDTLRSRLGEWCKACVYRHWPTSLMVKFNARRHNQNGRQFVDDTGKHELLQWFFTFQMQFLENVLKLSNWRGLNPGDSILHQVMNAWPRDARNQYYTPYLWGDPSPPETTPDHWRIYASPGFSLLSYDRMMYVCFRELIGLRQDHSKVTQRPYSANKWTQSFSWNENLQLGNWCHLCDTCSVYMYILYTWRIDYLYIYYTDIK